MKSTKPIRKRIRRQTREWLSELRQLGYGRVIWLIQSNTNFLLKATLFLLAVAFLMAGEYVLVTHLNHSTHVKTPQEASEEMLAATVNRFVPPPPSLPAPVLLRQALWYIQQNHLDTALDKVNAALKLNAQNPDAYVLRGHIYASQKEWDKADSDFQKIIEIVGDNPQARFDLAEVQFLQNNYDTARPGFVALEKDWYLGDLATYKVFLCDLFGGHEDAAGKSLKAFNAVGANASYYFGNAAWDLYHHKPQAARDWLSSAASIYSEEKFGLYTASLKDHGYLPLPPQL